MSSRPSSPRLAGSLPVISATVLGCALSIAAERLLDRGNRRRLFEDVSDLAEPRAKAIREQILRSLEVLHSIASFHATRAEMSRDEFRAFVRGHSFGSRNCRRLAGILGFLESNGSSGRPGRERKDSQTSISPKKNPRTRFFRRRRVRNTTRFFISKLSRRTR